MNNNTTNSVISLVTYLQELEENNKINESEYKRALKLVNNIVTHLQTAPLV